LARLQCRIGALDNRAREAVLRIQVILIGTFVAAMFATGVRAQSASLITEEMMVMPSDPGIEIYVHNKRPSEMSAFRPERTLLYVHGATYPASTSFDLKLDGVSWMEYLAQHGYDVWLLDLRGYGRSTRPKQMAETPDANAPIVRGDTALRDIGTVVDFILNMRNISKLNLMGWSWGTTLMATYTAHNPQNVARLVLYAPVWLRTTPSRMQTGPGPLGAYRMVTRAQAKERWYSGVPEEKKATLIPDGWFDTWADATWATDPVGALMDPSVLRAPNGVLQDSAEFGSVGKPYYDPSNISVPTLLVGAEWDHDAPPSMAQALFPLLINAPDKRYVELPEGTHTIMMEKNRLKLFETVQSFLDDGDH
jgi:pimeloyl-ACP methyl ester carboxylesterase